MAYTLQKYQGQESNKDTTDPFQDKTWPLNVIQDPELDPFQNTLLG